MSGISPIGPPPPSDNAATPAATSSSLCGPSKSGISSISPTFAAASSGEVNAPPRSELRLAGGDGLLIMPGHRPGHDLIVKHVGLYAGNGARGGITLARPSLEELVLRLGDEQRERTTAGRTDARGSR